MRVVCFIIRARCVQCRGQIKIFVYVSLNGMATIFCMAYDECLRFLFRCNDHRLPVLVFKLPLFFIKISKKQYKNSDIVDFSWFLNLNLGKEIKNLGLRTCTDIVPWHWLYPDDTKTG